MRFLASAFKNPLIQMLLVIACSFVVALGALRVPPVLSFAIVLLVLFIVLFVKNILSRNVVSLLLRMRYKD